MTTTRVLEVTMSPPPDQLVHYFEPQPRAGELPTRMPSPFATTPHPIAERAAQKLQKDLRQLTADWSHGDGKMFGVLVVRDGADRIGFLRAFSGMLDGSWNITGYVGPAFNEALRQTFWPRGEAEVSFMDVLCRLRKADESRTRQLVAKLHDNYRIELQEMQTLHADKKARRHEIRHRLASDDHVERAKLSLESQTDRRARRQLSHTHAAIIEDAERHLAHANGLRRRVEANRDLRCNGLLVGLQDTYHFRNAQGTIQNLRHVFGGVNPPGGAGDCAAPKLFQAAFAYNLKPIALAEFWHGKSPRTIIRRMGNFYPACRNKCAPILDFMLRGLDVEEPPRFGTRLELPANAPSVVYEDQNLVVVDKPAGMLSVPGRQPQLADSAENRLRTRYGPSLRVAHRLDLDTSGLLIAAKSADCYRRLQRGFAERSIEKYYVADVDGTIDGNEGMIDLPIRLDIDDRPRQRVDYQHGKPAQTHWMKIHSDGEYTRLQLQPKTGRTHQLRVHLAHADGLDCPIVGDRLYGRAGTRMHLHAQRLRFADPYNADKWLDISIPAPF